MLSFASKSLRRVLPICLIICPYAMSYGEDLMVLPPTPVITSGGQIDFFEHLAQSDQNNEVSVFYATRRLPTDDASGYRKTFDDTLRMGRADLLIGPRNLNWNLLHSEATSAERKHVIEINLEQVDQSGELPPDASLDQLAAGVQTYFDQINAALAKSKFKDITVIAHGAFNSFYYSMAEAAQYNFFTGKQAVVIAYSWPSVENHLAYKANAKHAEASEIGLVRLIKMLSTHSDAEKINLLGYSVGGRLVGGAMAKLADEYAGKDLSQLHKDRRLGHLYLTSSDEPLAEFLHYAPQFVQMFDVVTVTAAYDDPILGEAQLTGGGKRLGRPPKASDKKHAGTPEQKKAIQKAIAEDDLHLLNLEITEIPGYEFVHGAWYLNPWVSSDVLVCLNLDLDPGERGLESHPESDIPVWYFPAGYNASLHRALETHQQGSAKQ